MDINKIFGAFNSSSKDDGWGSGYGMSYTPSPRQIDENHPRYFIKMFQKLILNYTGYSDKIIDFFGQADPDLDIGEVKRAGENMLYGRAYNYLINIDVQDEYHVRILFEEANSKLEEALQKTLFFFENEEEYEKCAILKRYLDFLNFSS